MIGDGQRAQAAEQRRASRAAIETVVTLRLETTQVEGVGDNISEAGVMFFTDAPIRCVVEVAEEQGTRRFEGRIVRLQRMNDTNTGLAVEFDVD